MKRTPMLRWTPKRSSLRALTIRLPWAWLVVNGYKDIENRSRRTHYRGPLLIPAGLEKSEFNDDTAEYIKSKYNVDIPLTIELGGIVGIVDLVDCVENHSSPWYVMGNFGWVLDDTRRLPFRPCKGALGLFVPDLHQ